MMIGCPASSLARRGRRTVLLAVAAVAALACGPGQHGQPGQPDGPAAAEPAALRVMSFNVRFGTANDGEDAWPNRRARLLRVIADFDPTVLGVQEALRFQLDEIRAVMDHAGEVGVGRDDGVEAGEYSAILYDRRRLEVLDHGTFWLSETPGVPGSMTWGNRIPRIVTWVRFRDTATDTAFWVLNTHWDHESQDARERSAAQILDWLAAHAPGQPVLLMGDFNAGETNPAFRALLEAGDRGIRLRDSFRERHPRAGRVGTYHGFRGDRSGEKIDAVLASPEWAVIDAAIDTTAESGRYPSDHFPVTAVLVWSPRSAPDGPEGAR